jgi:predicted RNA binding protein YcfA (HicA-like mRNA interferase family)
VVGEADLDRSHSLVGLAAQHGWGRLRLVPGGLRGLNYAQFIRIVEGQGFSFYRRGKGSHSIYRAIIAGEVRLVTVSAHRPSEDIKPGTLDAMIRQSGLPKHLFR